LQTIVAVILIYKKLFGDSFLLLVQLSHKTYLNTNLGGNSPVPLKALKTTMIGISTNNGEDWYFVDTYGSDLKA